MKKSLLSTLLVCSLALTAVAAPMAVAADDYDQKIEQKDAKINDLKNQQADAQSQIDTLESEVADIKTESDALLKQQEELREATDKLETEISDLQVRIEKREETIQKQARDVQVNGGGTNFVDAVLNAESLTDAIGRVQAMNTMVNANNDLVKQQKDDQQAVKDKKAETDEKMQQSVDNQVVLEQQLGELQTKQADLAVLKTTLAYEQSSTESEKADLQEAKAAAEAEQARIQAEEQAAADARAAEEAAQAAVDEAAATAETTTTPSADTTTSNTPTDNAATNNTGNTGGDTTNNNTNNSGSTNTDTGSGSQVTPTPDPPASSTGSVVSLAAQHVGKSYVYGATGPDSFDCSGLVQYVFAQAGITMPRTTTQQEYMGTVISVDQAQAGDLFFWGSRGGTYHVAIATGGGGYIHASTPATGVCYGSVSSFAPSFAVRL